MIDPAARVAVPVTGEERLNAIANLTRFIDKAHPLTAFAILDAAQADLFDVWAHPDGLDFYDIGSDLSVHTSRDWRLIRAIPLEGADPEDLT